MYWNIRRPRRAPRGTRWIFAPSRFIDLLSVPARRGNRGGSCDGEPLLEFPTDLRLDFVIRSTHPPADPGDHHSVAVGLSLVDLARSRETRPAEGSRTAR